MSCDNDEFLTIPIYDNSLLQDTDQLTQFIVDQVDGLYVNTGSNSFLSDTIVVKWANGKLSVFSRKNAAFMILDGGSNKNSIVYEGYWRFARGTEIGLARLMIDNSGGSGNLLNGITPQEIIIKSFLTRENTAKSTTWKKISKLKEDNFFIVGHRGGGRNSDLLPHSENSIELIEYSEHLGANAVELDVRLTKDDIPILYHDEKLNTRLVNGEFMIGEIENYYLYELRNFCTLKRGEEIPTLEDALEHIVFETDLKFVWLDTKSAETVKYITELQLKYMQMAKDIGRELRIVIGLPTFDIHGAYLYDKNRDNTESLCELSFAEVRSADSKIWAPRWTLGLLTVEVQQMHSENREAIVWTVDDPDFIMKFVNSNFDGILTNYPALAAYEYYVK